MFQASSRVDDGWCHLLLIVDGRWRTILLLVANNYWWQISKGISQVGIKYIEINFLSWIDRFLSRWHIGRSVEIGVPGATVRAALPVLGVCAGLHF
jgi:hypothetical protein